jgi:hypothetical protein
MSRIELRQDQTGYFLYDTHGLYTLTHLSALDLTELLVQMKDEVLSTPMTQRLTQMVLNPPPPKKPSPPRYSTPRTQYHKLSAIDEEAHTAMCSMCNKRVPVRSKGVTAYGQKWACRVAINQRKRARARVPHTS